MKTILTIIFLSLCVFPSISQELSKMDEALEAMNYGEFENAKEIFTGIIKDKDPVNFYAAYYSRAYCLYSLRQYKNAKSDVKKALKIKKTDPNYIWIRGNGFWLHSNIISVDNPSPKSLKLLHKASKYVQTSVLYSTIGLEEVHLEKYQDALYSFRISLALDEDNAWAYSNRALAYMKLEKYDLAREDIIKSMKLDDENPFVYKHSALIYIALNDLESACSELEKAASLKTTSGMAENGFDEIFELKKLHCN